MALESAMRMFGGRQRNQTAEHARYDLMQRGRLVLLPRDIEVDGIILNVSRGGCLFRPLQSYLINRTGDMVMVAYGGERVAGRVMNTNARGYGIAFRELADLEMFGLRGAA